MKRKLANIFLAMASFVVALIVADVALNVLDIPPDRSGHQELLVEPDSIYGWRNIPNATGHVISDEYDPEVTYNEHGMRGPSLPYAKPSGKRRVVLVGDSFVDAYTEDMGDRVSDVLERVLESRSGLDVDVIALGAAGYSTDQELIWLENEGLRYEPDVVVLMFHPNDVWYNASTSYWRGGKPRFRLDGEMLTLTNVPVPPDTTTEQAGSGRGVTAWVRDHSKLYWLLARFVQDHPRLFGFAVRIGLTTPSPEMVFDATQGTVVAGEFSVFSASPPPETMEAWRITRGLIQRMRDTTVGSGADFLTFVIPMRSRIYTQFDDVRRTLAAGNTQIDMEAVTRQFEDLCRSKQIPYIDPTDAFIAAAESLSTSRKRLYYQYDWHWNANGHKLAGELLANHVLLLLLAREQPGRQPSADSVRHMCGALTASSPRESH